MKDIVSLIKDIKSSFPKADLNRVREIEGPLTEDDANLIRATLNSSKRQRYNVGYYFNQEDNTSYIHIRRLK